MKFSIRTVLLFSFLLVIWGTYLITATSTQVSSEQALEKHAHLIMENIASYAMEQSQNYLRKAEQAALLTERLLHSSVLGQNNPKALENYFFEQLQIYPDIAGIYLGTPNGEFFYVSRNSSHTPGGFRTKEIILTDGQRQVRLDWWSAEGKIISSELAPDDSYDPRKRPWYRGAIESQSVYWTDPYTFFTSRNPGITTSGPSFMADGRLRGVIGVDIEIGQLSTFISELRIGSSGRAFLLNRNHDVVAFHDVEKIKHQDPESADSHRLVKIDEFQDTLSRQVITAVGLPLGGDQPIQVEQPLSAKFESAGLSYQAMVVPFPDPHWPWVVGMYLPEDDYLAGLKETRSEMHLVMLAISLLASLLACWLARALSRPVVGLRHYAGLGELDVVPDQGESLSRSCFLEISETARRFETIQAELEDESRIRKDTEQSLLKKEEEYRSLIENLNVGVFRTTFDGRIVSANQAFVKMTGHPDLDSLKQRNVTEFYLSEGDRLDLLNILSKQGSVSNWQVQMQNGEEGRPTWVELNVALNRECVEGELFLDGLIEDISERKIQEEMLITSERMAAVGTLAGGVAHEFNNINTCVLGYAELGIQHPEASAQLADYFDLVRQSALRAKELTTSLLSMSNRNVTRMAPAQLNEVVEESLGLVAREYASEGIELSVDYQPLPRLMLDSSQIGQVVLNLLINARHALRGSSENRVEITTGQSDERAWVRVRDFGIGIPEEDLPRIFSPFFSTKGEHAAPGSQQAELKGSGLGLSVCHTIAQNHQGSLKVDSRPGEGACFTLFLPCVAVDDLPTERREPHVHAAKCSGRILVLDDEQVVRNMVSMVLAGEGYEVESTGDGNEALKMVQEGGVDLVLVDLQMPIMHGRDFLSRLRQMELSSPPLALVLTGLVGVNVVEEFSHLKVAGVIPKPFSLEVLKEQVLKTLNKPENLPQQG